MTMSERDIWLRLGIEPTKDRIAIRRAYATQLRGIDQDADPVSFMMLRDALSLALHRAPETRVAAAQAEAKAEILADEVPASVPPPPANEHTPERALQKANVEAAAQAFTKAGQAGRTEDAFVAYQALVANGAIILGAGIHPAAVQLGLLVARDKSLAMPRVNDILRALGLDAVSLDRLKEHKEIAELIALTTHRGAAERYIRLIEQCASQKLASWRGIRQRRRIILARYILGTWPVRGLVRANAFAREMKTYDNFSVWLETRVQRPERVDKAGREKELASLQRVEEATQLAWIVVPIVLLIVVAATVGPTGLSVVAAGWVGLNLARRFSIETKRR